MNILSEFKGKVYFYWWEEYGGSLVCSQHPEIGEKYIKIGESDNMDVKFEDPRAAMVESLKASLEKERAESRRRQGIILGKIQECLALEVSS